MVDLDEYAALDPEARTVVARGPGTADKRVSWRAELEYQRRCLEVCQNGVAHAREMIQRAEEMLRSLDG